MSEQENTYIAVDVEAAGNKLGIHSTLSIGACLVTREKKSFIDYYSSGHVFYAELRPESTAHDIEAMKVACSQLTCLYTIPKNEATPRFNHLHPDFMPEVVLSYMKKVCEDRKHAMKRFADWIKKVSPGNNKIIGITDTVFFDSGHVNLCFGKYSSEPSPFGWTGLDLDSLYRGYAKRADATLKELGLPDPRPNPHRADQDAVFLAQMSQVLLFEMMKW